MNRTSLKQFVEQWDQGYYIDKENAKEPWWDWFCRDSSLAGKTQKLGPKVKRIARSPKINPEKTYTFFKNNCPLYGSLYDDFRICDIETRDVIFTIIPACGHDSSKGQSRVWGLDDSGQWNELVKGSWKDVLAFFQV